MKWMGWSPRDLGYPCAMARHIEMVRELIAEEAERLDNPDDDDDEGFE